MPTSRNYEEGRRLLTLEINAAVEGFFAAGATEILVADGHGAGGVNQLLLDRRTLFMRGFPGPWPFGLEKGYHAAAWVGQHAKAGTPFAHIAHTGWFNVLDYRINGVSVGEFGQLVYCASSLGVPSIFGSGDEAFCREAAALVPGIETVAVKRGITPGSGDEYDTEGYRGRNLAAVHPHPEKARELIRAGAERALRRLAEKPVQFKLQTLTAPYRREVSYRPNGNTPAYRAAASHATDIIAMLNTPESRV
jgi:D-amino peptidase